MTVLMPLIVGMVGNCQPECCGFDVQQKGRHINVKILLNLYFYCLKKPAFISEGNSQTNLLPVL